MILTQTFIVGDVLTLQEELVIGFLWSYQRQGQSQGWQLPEEWNRGSGYKGRKSKSLSGTPRNMIPMNQNVCRKLKILQGPRDCKIMFALIRFQEDMSKYQDLEFWFSVR